MNKRLGFLSLIGVAALLLATFGANALAAPSGVAGTVTFDRAWTNLAQTIKVTVDDPDENKATLRVEDSDDRVDGTPLYSVDLNSPQAFYPGMTPIADWVGIDQLTVDTTTGGKTSVDQIVADLNATLGLSGASAITKERFFQAAGVTGYTGDQARLNALNNAREGNGLHSNDVLVVPADPAVRPSAIGLSETAVTITSSAGSGAFALVYFGSQADTVTVKLRSTSDQTGYSQTLTETAENTGVFEGTFTLATDTDADEPELAAANGNVITASYLDDSEELTRTATLSVELSDPEVSNLTPANGHYTNASTVVLTGDLVDAQSGVRTKDIKFYLDAGSGLFTEIPSEDRSDSISFSNDAYSVSQITGGVRASVRVTLNPATRATTQEYSWYLAVNDNAGNSGESKADPDEETTGMANAHKFTLDNQPLNLRVATPQAILGQWWDPTKEKDARLITTASKSRNTSIRVIFDSDLDGTSVDAGDFTVDGTAVAEALWFSGQKDSVFLTVGAKGPSATPKVEVASGSVRDAAGNANALALTVKTAKDGLAPKFTVEVTGDDTGGDVPVSDKQIVIKVGSDETLITNPSIQVGIVEKDSTSGDLVLKADSQVSVTGLTFLGNDEWERKLSVGSYLNTRTGGASAFVITVSGQDTASNVGKSGTTDPEKSSAILFEMDNAIPTPEVVPGDKGSVTRSDPFINIKWMNEGSEYAGDTHKKVTLTVLKLDDEDVLDRAATTDSRTFILTTSGLALGDHTVEVNGMDESGNDLSSNHEITFTVKARPKTSIELKPGMNLVSFPGDPADTSINSVVTLSQVSAISTYDAATGTWLSATRDESGLSGSLEQIDGQHAYWVSTTSFDPIKVDIPRQGFGNVPPAIPVVEGWNLVPVVVIGDQTVKTIAADTYTSWVTAYTFDPLEGQWTKVLPGNFHDVEVGKGYWLYVEQAGVLVP